MTVTCPECGNDRDDGIMGKYCYNRDMTVRWLCLDCDTEWLREGVTCRCSDCAGWIPNE